jgi:hypothetical protein
MYVQRGCDPINKLVLGAVMPFDSRLQTVAKVKDNRIVGRYAGLYGSHGIYLATAYAFVAQTETTMVRAVSVNFIQVDDGRHIANLILLNRNTAMATASDSRLSLWRKMPIGPKAMQYRDARPALPSRALGFGGVAQSPNWRDGYSSCSG